MILPLREAKSALRARLITAREAVGDPAGGSAATCERLLRLPELAGARRVAGYAARGTEVDIDAALRSLIDGGTVVCLPWVDGPDLRLAPVTELDADLAPGWRGVREPAAGRRSAVRPELIDVVMVPGVAFDAEGNRLGYGGGHFDRLLARLRRGAVTVGVAFDEQLVDRVPVEEHDRPVDLVVTPTRTVRPRGQD